MPLPETYQFDSADEYWSKTGKQAQVWSGADVRIVFSVTGTTPAYKADKSMLESLQLQTITMSSASSVFPVRRVGEARATTYTKGTRTFAGSIVFSIIGEDPLQRLFSVDALRSSARTDSSWHIDQMPPIDAILIYANESGHNGIQVVQGMQFTHWGQTVSIDDMYLESTYSYTAEHITPFMSYDSFAPSLANENEILTKVKRIVNRVNSLELTPDDAIRKMSEEFSYQQIQKYGDFLASVLADIFDKYHSNRITQIIKQSTVGPDTIAGSILSQNAGSVGFLEYLYGPEIPQKALFTNLS